MKSTACEPSSQTSDLPWAESVGLGSRRLSIKILTFVFYEIRVIYR